LQRREAIAALLFTPVVLGLESRVQAAELGPKQLAAMLLRILAYDRNIKARSNGRILPIMVIYQEGNSPSEAIQSDVTNALEDLAGSVTVVGLRVQVVSLAYSNIDELNAKIVASHPVAMFVCTGLSVALPNLIATARKHAILTMTMTTAYIKAGLSIGLERGDERVNILINLPATRAEGADIDTDLLRVAEVFR
jgi:hypothetical protein